MLKLFRCLSNARRLRETELRLRDALTTVDQLTDTIDDLRGSLERQATYREKQAESFLATITRLQEQLHPVPPPKHTVAITFEALFKHLRFYFPGASLWLFQDQYRLPSRSDLERFLAWDDTDLRPYRPGQECGYFSLALLGGFKRAPGWEQVAVGSLVTVRLVDGERVPHGWNWAVLSDMSVLAVEPQGSATQVLQPGTEALLVLG
jgi:hypothetical protein